jgi:hypothetical protein
MAFERRSVSGEERTMISVNVTTCDISPNHSGAEIIIAIHLPAGLSDQLSALSQAHSQNRVK